MRNISRYEWLGKGAEVGNLTCKRALLRTIILLVLIVLHLSCLPALLQGMEDTYILSFHT